MSRGDALAAIAALAAIVGRDYVITDPVALAPALTDWRGRYHGRAAALVLPASTSEVAAVLACCADAGLPVVPQGGNTGLVGGATPDDSGRAVIVNLRRMNRVLAVDPANNTLSAEAGCLLGEVQDAARRANRLFPLSLAAEGSCSIGGNIATNAGGVHVVRYGSMRDLVLGLEVVLPDGRVWDGMTALRKNNTGYDLKHLFIGAEGTLGVVTRAVLKLHPLPTVQAVAWLAIPSPAAAVDVFGRLQERFGARLNAFELLSRPVLDVLFRHFPQAIDPLPGASWAALVELCDGGNRSDEARLLDTLQEELAALADAQILGDAAIAQSHAQAEAFWWLREHAPEAEKRDGVAIKHDIALPVSAVPAFLEQAAAALAGAFPGCEVLAFGHLGDGNLHYNVRHRDPAQNPALLARQDEVNRVVYELVAGFKGSISAEHGIGQLKRDVLPAYKSAVELDLMRAVKQAIDPSGRMNPGKVLGTI